TPFGELLLHPDESVALRKDYPLYITITPPLRVALSYMGAMKEGLVNRSSSVVRLTVNETNRKRGENFLYRLLEVYSRETMSDKNRAASVASEFIQERLVELNEDLRASERSVEEYKRENRISVGLLDEALLYLANDDDLSKSLVSLGTKALELSYLRKAVEDNADNLNLLPSGSALANDNVLLRAALERYNREILGRDRLLSYATEEALIVKKANERLVLLRQEILNSIEALEYSQGASRNAIEGMISHYGAETENIPRKEMELADLLRQQIIESNLYVDLLKRKQELDFTLRVSAPSVRIIDSPLTSGLVTPRKAYTYFLCLALGLIFPFIIIGIRELLNYKLTREDEVRKLSERVRFGLKRSVESGIVLGNDVIWGYKKDKGKLTIDEKEAEIVRQIYHLYANERLGFRVLANRLAENGHYNTKGNKFGGSTLRRIISNPKYKGYFVGGKSQKYDYRQKQTNIDRDKWIIYKDEQTVPPIVSEELWEKANRILLKRREQIISEDKSSYQNKYPYSGKIMCMTHNAPYYHSIRKTDKPSGDYWRCKRNHNGEGCASPVVYTSELDEIMRVVMQNIFTNRESIISDLLSRYAEAGQKSELTVDIAKLKVRIAEIDKKKEGLIDLYVEGKLDGDGFKVHNDKLCDEAKGLESQITDYDNQVAKNRDFARQTQTLRSIITKELTFEESVSDGVISELLDRIEIRRGTSNPNKLNLRIYLKVADGYDDYNIFRNRGKSSAVALNKSAQTEGFSEKYVKCTRSDW
ncbi:MAG: recombinase family protein, partial [Oscillospiraceae bacterium]|nr:recombinase family protein [Oscillospiraceae bacterium]